jgi:hypothetical protein
MLSVNVASPNIRTFPDTNTYLKHRFQGRTYFKMRKFYLLARNCNTFAILILNNVRYIVSVLLIVYFNVSVRR